jgi:hypothetical protein
MDRATTVSGISHLGTERALFKYYVFPAFNSKTLSPHSGQEYGDARKSYPHVLHLPAFRQLATARRTNCQDGMIKARITR